MNAATEGIEREFQVADPRALEALNRSEIDTQISTAKRFPRTVTKFHAEATSLVSLTEQVAEECIYALERTDRDGKTTTIEGPSARFAEVIAYAWGNCRAGARVIDESGEFVTAQGVFWDLEKNVAIGYEVKRRIVNRSGRRFNADMIGVTANAACSIALRNAILKGVPKALWSGAYEAARHTVMGDVKTLSSRRDAAITSFAKFGVKPEQLFAKVGVSGLDDVTPEHLLTLRGILTSIRDGDTTVEDQFPSPAKDQPAGTAAAVKAALVPGAGQPGGNQPAQDAAPASGEGAGAPPAAGPGVDDQPAPDQAAGGQDQAQAAGDGNGLFAETGPAPGVRRRGTPRLRKQYLERLLGCGDAQTIDVIMDETRMFDWSPAEHEELGNAFKVRKLELAEGRA